MKKPEPGLETMMSDEQYTRREQCGVEIVEHEVITRIKTSDGRYVSGRSRPRLVITDAMNATRDFVSKRRSELGELDRFLKTVGRRPLHGE
ncbi:MAG: hypothetical protein ACK4S4_05040 [Pyrinomonadaceae bacterium]